MSEHLDQVAQHPNTASQPLEVLLHYGQQGPRCTQPGKDKTVGFSSGPLLDEVDPETNPAQGPSIPNHIVDDGGN